MRRRCADREWCHAARGPTAARTRGRRTGASLSRAHCWSASGRLARRAGASPASGHFIQLLDAGQEPPVEPSTGFERFQISTNSFGSTVPTPAQQSALNSTLIQWRSPSVALPAPRRRGASLQSARAVPRCWISARDLREPHVRRHHFSQRFAVACIIGRLRVAKLQLRLFDERRGSNPGG